MVLSRVNMTPPLDLGQGVKIVSFSNYLLDSRMSDHAPSLNALADGLLHALFLTMRRIRRENAQAARMGYPDLMILFYLRRSPGIGVSDLAAEAGAVSGEL